MSFRHVLATVSIVVVIPLTAASARAAVRPHAAAAPVSCAIPQPCAMFSNTSTGAAVEGASASGTGLFGTSSSGVYYAPGVDGESSDADGEDAGGAFGINVMSTGIAPQYGVIAYGNGIGVAGEGNSAGTSVYNSAYGVLGQDTTGSDSNGADYNVGVVGASTVGTALLGESNASPTSSIFGEAPVAVYAVASSDSALHNGLAIDFFGETSDAHTTGLLINNYAKGGGMGAVNANYLLFGTKSTGTPAFQFDYDGNESLTGTLTTSKGGPYVRTTGASGAAMMEYTDRTTTPEVEDFGEGRLTGGRAYVNIDARLADTIDRRTSYHVFVTPEGDCKGLYVEQKTPAGFVVRELQGGRSSLAFEYRIVAKPRDEDGARLANAPALKNIQDDDFGRKSSRNSRPPLSPQERLKSRMGTQAYAQAMLRFRASRQVAP